MKLGTKKEIDQAYLNILESIQGIEESFFSSPFTNDPDLFLTMREAGTEVRKALQIIWKNASGLKGIEEDK